ncbi:MAG TPA: protein kinase, partial [Candidatus Eremiobacteraeota bacterium]|nr:protein kinase [Candidatus Eremiobacteraeota bacterium]
MVFEKGDFIYNKYKVDKISSSDEDGANYICNYQKGFKLVKQIFSVSKDKNKKKIDLLFLERCKIFKSLNHRNLVKIEDFFIEEDSYYVVMEYIKGKSLEDIYRKEYKEKNFPSNILIKYILKVCDGLKYLHGQEPPLIYGSLSPGHIIIGGGEIVKLLNYGFSNIVKKGRNTGFAGFSSLEQISGEKEDIKSDIYSLGALMYYFLTGNKVAAGTRKLEKIVEFNPDVSKNLGELVIKCLSKKLSNRPDITDLSRQLSKIYLSETVLRASKIAFPVLPSEQGKEETESKVTMPVPNKEDMEKSDVGEGEVILKKEKKVQQDNEGEIKIVKKKKKKKKVSSEEVEEVKSKKKKKSKELPEVLKTNTGTVEEVRAISEKEPEEVIKKETECV